MLFCLDKLSNLKRNYAEEYLVMFNCLYVNDYVINNVLEYLVIFL